jgi:hypothetical protein
MYRSPTYNSWEGMKQRCNNPNHNRFEHYGGRGITYDPKWETFEGFLRDMGVRPPDRTLERDDVHGNYTKSNCSWETVARQARNKQDTVWVTYKGERRVLRDLVDETDHVFSTVRKRIENNWSVEDALDTPPKEAALYAFAGSILTLQEWADRLGWPRRTLHDRIEVKGWPIEKALSTKPDAKMAAASAKRRR